MSASVASPSTTAFFSMARSSAIMSSRRRAACSYSIAAAASFIFASTRRMNLAVSPAMKSQKSSASA